jgi:hypothetical protein
MPKALTWETMSPGLLKGGETRSPEPHRRKSRMREIRLSGSGEGLGWATSQPTLQRHFVSAFTSAPCSDNRRENLRIVTNRANPHNTVFSR